MHCAQEHNSHSFFPDVADHGEAAIKSEFCAVNLPGFGSLYQRRDVWLVLPQSPHNREIFLQEVLRKRHTGEE